MATKTKPERRGEHKLLALDGGGIRGLITIEVLARLEDELRGGRGKRFRLAEAFDYVAGTSTGAVLATCVSLGMSVDEIRSFYLDSGPAMFSKAHLLDLANSRFGAKRLIKQLTDVLGEDTTLGTTKLRTLLMMVMRNASTDSPWPVSNNPRAMYNDVKRRQEGKACNLDLKLWQLVRASTAAPTYFPPEVIDAGGPKPFVMVDGGVTTYNNPAFLLFLMSTMAPYKVRWPTGVEKMMVVSIGTGTSPRANLDLSPRQMNMLFSAGSVPSALMFAALNEQDMLCRVFGECRHGAELDREIGDLIGAAGPVKEKLFAYVRYNAELTPEWLNQQGLGDIKPKNVQRLDSTEHMQDLLRVGKRVADQVAPEHFRGF